MRIRRSKNFLSYALIFIALLEIGLMVGLIYRKAERNFYPRDYYSIVEHACAEYDLPVSLMLAVIKTESDFQHDTVSRAGAIGLMQLMPDTYIWFASKTGNDSAKKNDLYDPEINIDYGCAYFAYLYDKFGDYNIALAAYNAGPTRVYEWLSDLRYSSDGVTLKNIPYDETAKYVETVTKRAEKYRQIYNIK